MRYKTPAFGAGAPYDLSGAETARWAQTEPPVSATAVFPPTQVPTGNQSTGVLPSSWERAPVTYLDANGRTLNTAASGGYVTTTGYDHWGDTIRTPTAANRARALDASGSDTAADDASIAAQLSTANLYSTDGLLLLQTFGPEHTVALPDGTTVGGLTDADARVTKTEYDWVLRQQRLGGNLHEYEHAA